ncbi:MAG: hydrogenase iron-sulfur subunit [Dehalococcoidia bacterium]|nr:hydrogenase iron-sulfur subunit [Dehalococcoidia bacterium]
MSPIQTQEIRNIRQNDQGLPFETEIVVLYCGRALTEGNHLPEGRSRSHGFSVRFIKLACSSKIEVGNLISLIEEGVDGVVLVACPQEQCQFMLGSIRAKNRVKKARRLLEETGMDGGRLGFIQAHNLSDKGFVDIAENHAETVRNLGPNPMKSMER